MTVWKKLMAAALVSAAGLCTAQAAEFKVGRATVVFPTDGWTVAELPDQGSGYGGDRTGVIASETKLFVKAAPDGNIETVAVVRSSKGGLPGSIYMTYDRECSSTDVFFAEGNTGEALRIAQCLSVHPRYTMSSLLKSLGEPGKSVLEAHQGELPDAMHEITSNFANSNGTFVTVSVWLAPGFEGSPGTVSEALPKNVEASHVVWGRALNKAVRGSVTSLFGTLRFPALSFSRTPPGSAGNRIALSTPPGH
jgi:hypothetical protein